MRALLCNQLACMDLNSAHAEFIRAFEFASRGLAREREGILFRVTAMAKTSHFPVIFIDIHEHLCNVYNGEPHFLLYFARE